MLYKKGLVMTFLKQNIILLKLFQTKIINPSISLTISLALLFGMCLKLLSVSNYFQLGKE